MSLIIQKSHELVSNIKWDNSWLYSKTTIISILAKRILEWNKDKPIFLNQDGIIVWSNWCLWFNGNKK